MEWWQIVLVILTSIIVGLLVGGLLGYLILLLQKKLPFKKLEMIAVVVEQLKKRPFFRKRETTIVFEERLKRKLFFEEPETRAVIEEQQKKKPAFKELETTAAVEEQLEEKPVFKEPEPTVAVEEQRKLIAPNLLAEVENNLRIATEPWTGELLPFQTHEWDTSRDEVNTMPATLQEDLTQAYADIRLANSIVWLSTELGRRSPDLDESYMKLCANIAAGLDKIMPLLKQ